MCPVCVTTAVLISGSVSSTSGLAAIAIKMFGVKKAADKKNGAGELIPNAKEKLR